MVTVPKGVSSFDIKLPIVESGLEPKQKLTVNVTAFVRGYAMTNPTQTVVVSDHYYTVVSLKNNSDNIINEGDEFTIQVQTPVPVKDDMDINITIPDDQKSLYETLPPVTLTVNAGETLAEAKVKTKHNLSPTQHETLVLNFTTISVMYPLDNDKMEIIMKDLEAGRVVNFLTNAGYMIIRGSRLLPVEGRRLWLSNMAMLF